MAGSLVPLTSRKEGRGIEEGWSLDLEAKVSTLAVKACSRADVRRHLVDSPGTSAEAFRKGCLAWAFVSRRATSIHY